MSQNTTLLEDISSQAAKEAAVKEARRRTTLRQHLSSRKKMHQRAALAIACVRELCAIGRSREFQSLMESRNGRTILLWGYSEVTSPGYDMADVSWEWVTAIALTTHSVMIENFCGNLNRGGSRTALDDYISEGIPYTLDDPFLIARRIWHLVTPDPLDLEELRIKDTSTRYSPELLFEMLIEYSNPKNFTRAFRAAMKGL